MFLCTAGALIFPGTKHSLCGIFLFLLACLLAAAAVLGGTAPAGSAAGALSGFFLVNDDGECGDEESRHGERNNQCRNIQ